MSRPSYKPGTVAWLTIGMERVPAIAQDDVWQIAGHSFFKSIALDNEVLIEKVSPLVALDLVSLDSQPETIVRAIRRVASTDTFSGDLFHDLAEMIEAQTQPAKPEEPKGIGAVVSVTSGVRWVRKTSDPFFRKPWVSEPSGDRAEWAELQVQEIVSEGVSA